MSGYFDQRWLRSRMFCLMSASCNFPKDLGLGSCVPLFWQKNQFFHIGFSFDPDPRDDQYIKQCHHHSQSPSFVLLPILNILPATTIAFVSWALRIDIGCFLFLFIFLFLFLRIDIGCSQRKSGFNATQLHLLLVISTDATPPNLSSSSSICQNCVIKTFISKNVVIIFYPPLKNCNTTNFST